MGHECLIEDQKETPTIVRETTVAVEGLPAFLGATFGPIVGHIQKKSARPAGMPFVIYYNMDMKALKVEAGFPVDWKIDGEGDMVPSMLPPCKIASTMHVGPYDSVKPAYDDLMTFVKERGLVPTGIAYEMYFDGPETQPEKIRTRIVFQLA